MKYSLPEMNTAEYKQMAKALHEELEDALEQQEEIERKIARLKQALLGLAPLANQPESSFLHGVYTELASVTITDACRQIFMAAKTRLSPIEIKQQLIAMGQDLSNHKNVMASIHSMLKRLEASDEIETKDNGLTYQWKPRRSHRPPFGGKRSSNLEMLRSMTDKGAPPFGSKKTVPPGGLLGGPQEGILNKKE